MSTGAEDFQGLIEDQLVNFGLELDEIRKRGPVRIKVDDQDVVMEPVTVAEDATGKLPRLRLTTIYDAVKRRYPGDAVDIVAESKPVAPAFGALADAAEIALEAAPGTAADARASQLPAVPILCHREHMRPVAVCRVCMVEIKGPGVLVPACQRPIEAGKEYLTIRNSPKAQRAVNVLTALLMADHHRPREAGRQYEINELELLAEQLQRFNSERGLRMPEFRNGGIERGGDESSPVIAVDHNLCIVCDRCVRACDEVKENGVIGRMNKGYAARIAFDLNDPMGDSSCVACGECMISCPTGALSNRLVIDIRPKSDAPRSDRLLAGEEVPIAEIAADPLFKDISRRFLEWNQNAFVRRRFKRGETVCREGEFGATAFRIKSGTFDVRINALSEQAATKSGGLFSWLTGGGGKRDTKGESRDKEGIFIDAPGSLAREQSGQLVARLGPDEEIFGEMTCMNHYPRSATVVAASDDCEVWELLRNVLYMLRRSDSSKRILDRLYRERSLDNLLQRTRLFADLRANSPDLFAKVVTYLKEPDKHRVKLIRVHPGQVIFREGAEADHFYMVRIGFVKVSQQRPGGERVLGYLGPGDFFGEIALLAQIPEIRQRLGVSERRTATCTAMDHVDLMRIDGNAFHEILKLVEQSGGQISNLAANPVLDHLEQSAAKSLAANEASRQRMEHVPLEEFLRQGLMEAQSVLLLDLDKCTRCDECSKACVDAHPPTRDDPVSVTRLIRDGLRFDKYLVASSCRACLDPYSMVGCPVGSIHRDKNGTVLIEDWCVGCGLCERNCPYGNIKMHDTQGRAVATARRRATTCDHCVGLDGQPSCVYACPHDAAHRMTGQELIELVGREAGRRK
jgi:CRP-like cAMP-binding protein/Fe-S-cluster-containing dehydrogenase component